MHLSRPHIQIVVHSSYRPSGGMYWWQRDLVRALGAQADTLHYSSVPRTLRFDMPSQIMKRLLPALNPATLHSSSAK